MSVPLTYLIERVRLATDHVSSSFFTDGELTQYINAAGAELHDVLVGTYEDYLLSSSVFTINTGESYTPSEEVLKIRGIDFQRGTDFVPCLAFNFAERYQNNNNRIFGGRTVPTYRWAGGKVLLYPETSNGGTYQLWFVPSWTDLNATTNPTLPAPYTHNHWEEYIVIDAAIRGMAREESDVTTLFAQKQAIAQRIRLAANQREASGRKRVADTSMDQFNRRYGYEEAFSTFDSTFDETFV